MSREEAFPGEWQPIASVPRDGRVVKVTDFETGAFPMWWNEGGRNPVFQQGVGIWETITGDLTWSEEKGCGPTHWQDVNTSTSN